MNRKSNAVSSFKLGIPQNCVAHRYLLVSLTGTYLCGLRVLICVTYQYLLVLLKSAYLCVLPVLMWLTFAYLCGLPVVTCVLPVLTCVSYRYLLVWLTGTCVA